MRAKIGINGLGRIGRMVLRSIFEEKHKGLQINHINNRADIRTAYDLIKRDSIHGKFRAKISIEKNKLVINGNKITYSQESNLNKIIILSLGLVISYKVPMFLGNKMGGVNGDTCGASVVLTETIMMFVYSLFL